MFFSYRALASSAPMFQLNDMAPCDLYYKAVTKIYHDVSPGCQQNIRNLWSQINTNLQTGDFFFEFFSSHTNNLFPSILVALKVSIRRLVVAYVCSFVSQILVGLNFPNNGTSVNWSRASGTLLTSRNGSKLCSQPWQWPTIRTLATSWHHYLPTQSRLVNVFWCLSINLLSSPMKEISLFNSFVQIGNMYEKLHEVVWERVWEKSFFLVFFWENYILNWM